MVSQARREKILSIVAASPFGICWEEAELVVEVAVITSSSAMVSQARRGKILSIVAVSPFGICWEEAELVVEVVVIVPVLIVVALLTKLTM